MYSTFIDEQEDPERLWKRMGICPSIGRRQAGVEQGGGEGGGNTGGPFIEFNGVNQADIFHTTHTPTHTRYTSISQPNGGKS